ncbi:glycolate oxidase [Xylaria castorea]|nr:glycolate oxidase [Xylaria castorea]
MAAVDGAEVAKHDIEKGCLVVMHTKAWDVSEGAGVISPYSSRDATEAYYESRLEAIAATTATSISTAYPHLAAKQYLTPTGWAYYARGAEDEVSFMDTRRLFKITTFQPHILRCVEPVSAAVRNCNAESASACAVGKEGAFHCMPTTTAHGSVFASQSEPNKPLKLEALGVSALFLAVDSPVLGRREGDERIKITDSPEVSSSRAKVNSAGLLSHILSWEDLKWMRETTSMLLMLKGVQAIEDAVLTYNHRVQGIVLSSRGGRLLDTTQAPIVTILKIRKHTPHLLAHQIPLALGASAVGIGRLFFYSLTTNYGEADATRLFQVFRSVIKTSMTLAGAATAQKLVPKMVNSERAESEVS